MYEISEFKKYYSQYDIKKINNLLENNLDEIVIYNILNYILDERNTIYKDKKNIIHNNNYFLFDILNKIINSCEKFSVSKNIFDTIYLNCLIKKHGIISFLKKHSIDFYNKYDNYGYSLILDCAKYGDYNTFLYLYNNTQANYLHHMYKNCDVLSLSLYNNDTRIFEFLYNNFDNLIKLIDINKELNDTELYDKQKYCINLIIELIPVITVLNENNFYKKMSQIIKIIDYPFVINNLINNFSINLTFKFIKKYSKIIDISKINQYILHHKYMILKIYDILEHNNDIINIKNLYSLLFFRFNIYKHLIDQIIFKYGQYFDNNMYYNILYNLTSSYNYKLFYFIKTDDELKDMMLFLKTKIDYNKTKCLYPGYHDNKFIYSIFVSGLYKLYCYDNLLYSNYFKKWCKTLEFLKKTIQKKKN